MASVQLTLHMRRVTSVYETALQRLTVPAPNSEFPDIHSFEEVPALSPGSSTRSETYSAKTPPEDDSGSDATILVQPSETGSASAGHVPASGSDEEDVVIFPDHIWTFEELENMLMVQHNENDGETLAAMAGVSLEPV